MPHRNLAARLGHWSATHRRLAVFGWLGLVVVALALSAGVGLNTIPDEELGNGESRQGDQVLADSGFYDRATEQVLVQARGDALTVRSPAFRAAVADVAKRAQAFAFVRDVKSPLASGNEGQVSKDQRSALVVFDILGDSDTTKDRVAPVLASVAAAQRAHPELRIEQFGDASADKALSKAFEDAFKKAESLSLPLTLIILVIAFGSLVAAGLPLLLGISA